MNELEFSLDIVFKQCDNDCVKFLFEVTNYLQRKTDFTDGAITQMLKNSLKKSDEAKCASPSFSKNKSVTSRNSIGTIFHNASSSTLHESSLNKVLVPATQYIEQSLNTSENSFDFLDESVHDSKILNGTGNSVAIQQNAAEKCAMTDDEDEVIIPETQYIAGDSLNNSRASSRASNRTSSRNSMRIKYNGWDQNKDNGQSNCSNRKSNMSEVEDEDDDDFLQVNYESTNNTMNYVTEQESQNVMANFDRSILIGMEENENNESHDSAIVSLTNADGTVKMNNDDLEISALKLKDSIKSFNVPSVDMTDAQKSADIRSTSITPELDIFLSLNADTHNRSDLRSPTPDFVSANSNSTTKRDKTNKSPQLQKPTNEIEELAVDTNSNGSNDLFAACTQIFPKQKLVKETATQVVPKTIVNGSKVEDDIFDAPTQKMPTSADAHSSKENSTNKSNNGKLPAPKSKFTFKQPTAAKLAIAPSKNTIYEVATQEFTPPEQNEEIVKEPNTSKSTKRNLPKIDDIFEMATQKLPLLTNAPQSNDVIQTNVSNQSDTHADEEDDIFGMATQILPAHCDTTKLSPPETSQQTIKSYSIFTESQGESENTPDFSLAKHIPVTKLAETIKTWSNKQKKIQKQKWLFADSSDEDEVAAVVPVTATKIDNNNERSTEKVIKEQPQTIRETSKRKSVTTTSHPVELDTKRARQLKKSTEEVKNSDDLMKIARRRVSVVLERMNFDQNFNEKEVSSKQPAEDKKSVKEKIKKEPTSESNSKTIKAIKVEKSEPTQRESRKRANKIKSEKEIIESKHIKTEPENRRNSSVSNTSGDNRTRSGSTSTTRHSSTDSVRSATRSSSRLLSVSGASSSHQIMFTKIDLDGTTFKEDILQMGGNIVDCPRQSTVLICERIYRTCKLLSALCKGVPIVTPNWLIKSRKKNKFVDTEPYLLLDAVTEKRFHFSLKISLDMAKNRSLFKNYVIFVTPNVLPTPQEISEIIECGGGHSAFDYKDVLPPNTKTFLVSSKTDAKLWSKYRRSHPNIQIVNTEGFMLSVMRQRLEFSGHLLCK